MGKTIKKNDYWFMDEAYAECVYAWGYDRWQTERSEFSENCIYKIVRDDSGLCWVTGVKDSLGEVVNIRLTQDSADACVYYVETTDDDDPDFGGVTIFRLLHKADYAAECFFIYKSLQEAYGKSRRFDTERQEGEEK